MFFQICRFILWLPVWLIFPTVIKGRENLQKGKAIITPNHTSNLDILLILANTFEKKYVLSKKELFKNKFIGFFIKLIGGISIDRNNPDIKAMKNCLNVLKNEKKLIIFPEGTRNKGDVNQLGEIKNGTGMFAVKSKAKIIPVWISKRPKCFRLTKIIIGKPYELDEFYGKKLNDEDNKLINNIIKEKMIELK